MNKELKTKWLEALRSGDYKQGTRRLRTQAEDGGASYCCLGVLTEIVHGKDCWSGNVVEGDRTACYSYSKAECTVLPSNKDMDDWGLFETKSFSLSDLTRRNDGTQEFHANPQTFEQIADWIDENL